jgi:hypothetical protein
LYLAKTCYWANLKGALNVCTQFHVDTVNKLAVALIKEFSGGPQHFTVPSSCLLFTGSLLNSTDDQPLLPEVFYSCCCRRQSRTSARSLFLASEAAAS